MQEYQKIDRLIHDFYTHKNSVESFLQSGNFFDSETKEKYNSSKEQCLYSLLLIFSLVKQDSVNANVRIIAVELAQALSLVKTPDMLSWNHLSSLSGIIKRIDVKISYILQNKYQESKNVRDFEFGLLTERVRNFIGMPMESCSVGRVKSFLHSRRYMTMDFEQLHSLLAEIDKVMTSSLLISHEFTQTSYTRFPGFLSELKDVINDVIKKKNRITPMKKISSFLDSEKKEDTEKHKDDEFVSSSHVFAKNIDNHLDEDDDRKELPVPKKGYLHRLTVDWNNLLIFINISEEITEDTYEDVLDEYKGYLLSHDQRKNFEKMIDKCLIAYKSYCSRTGKKHWMGEAMIYLKKNSFIGKKEKKLSSFTLHQQALQKKAEEEKALLCKQSVYFPQIIKRLKTFKTYFKARYFSASVPEIREGFLQVYESMISQFVTKLNPELLVMDDRASADYKHWKYELYKGIPSVIQKGSDELIERGVAQGFIFGEIDDLIQNLQKIYEQNKHYTPTLK